MELTIVVTLDDQVNVFDSVLSTQMGLKKKTKLSSKKFNSEIFVKIPQRLAADGPHKLLLKLEWIAEKLEIQDHRRRVESQGEEVRLLLLFDC